MRVRYCLLTHAYNKTNEFTTDVTYAADPNYGNGDLMSNKCKSSE
jgi:hypothetical protein